ncbi:MAG TPA: MCE family protein [Frankiaceae bacterium]|jgi:phospholipid/cholesterol/gamma-HCH transport system substrate-binding protein|nr:MCE family protein [Frankiaceae bacterium]
MLERLTGPESLRRISKVLIALLLLGIIVYAWPSKGQKSATIYFSRTVHIYKGGDVDVLGVKVGSITGVHPDGDRVKVTIKYNASQRIPANASAVILTPTLVADRVVQLTPAYTGGALLANKATIPLQKTGVPLELDQVFANLNELAKDVGPNGANSNGALSNLFNVAANNLSGEGNDIHSTITSVSQLAGTLDDNKGALFQTIKNLQSFTTLLAQHDSDTRAFTDDLAKVGDELNGDRTALAQALSNLNSALGDVTSFVQNNKADLQSNVAALARVTNVLVKDKDTLGKLIDIGALGATNYTHVYDPGSQSFDGRFSENNIVSTPALFACSVLGAVGVNADSCLNILKGFGLDKVKLPLDQLSSLGSGSSAPSLNGLLGVGK